MALRDGPLWRLVAAQQPVIGTLLNVSPAMSPISLKSVLQQDHLPGLDFLRMVAVLTVLLLHLELPGIGPLLIIDGVQLFFVVSGFLITWMLLRELDERSTIDMGRFYLRRAARLLPIFFAYLLVGYLLLTLRRQPVDWGAIGSSVVYLINYYQAFTGAPTHYLSHCWSLAVEEQFYLIWPLALVGLRARRVRLEVSLTLLILGVWLLRPLLMLGFGVSEIYLYRALETRADHLLIGCLLAVLLRQPLWQSRFDAAARHWWSIPLLIGLLAAVSTYLHPNVALKFGLAFALEPVLLALLIPLMLIAASGQGWVARLLNLRPLVLIGQVSYGMYLMHPFITQPIYKRVEAMSSSSALGVAAALAGSVGLAYLSFRFFEEPIRARIRSGWRSSSRQPLPQAGT